MARPATVRSTGPSPATVTTSNPNAREGVGPRRGHDRHAVGEAEAERDDGAGGHGELEVGARADDTSRPPARYPRYRGDRPSRARRDPRGALAHRGLHRARTPRSTRGSGCGTRASTRSSGRTSARPTGPSPSCATCSPTRRADGFVPHMTYWHDPDLHADFWGRRGDVVASPNRRCTATRSPSWSRRGVDASTGALVERAPQRACGSCSTQPAARTALGRRSSHPWESGCDDSPRWDAWCPGPWTCERWKRRKGELVEALAVRRRRRLADRQHRVRGRVGRLQRARRVQRARAGRRPTGGRSQLAAADVALARRVWPRWSTARRPGPTRSGRPGIGRGPHARGAAAACWSTDDPSRRSTRRSPIALDDPRRSAGAFGPTERAPRRADLRSVHLLARPGVAAAHLPAVGGGRAPRPRRRAAWLRRPAWSGAPARSGFAEYWHPDTGEGSGRRAPVVDRAGRRWSPAAADAVPRVGDRLVTVVGRGRARRRRPFDVAGTWSGGPWPTPVGSGDRSGRRVHRRRHAVAGPARCRGSVARGRDGAGRRTSAVSGDQRTSGSPRHLAGSRGRGDPADGLPRSGSGGQLAGDAAEAAAVVGDRGPSRPRRRRASAPRPAPRRASAEVRRTSQVGVAGEGAGGCGDRGSPRRSTTAPPRRPGAAVSAGGSAGGRGRT